MSLILHEINTYGKRKTVLYVDVDVEQKTPLVNILMVFIIEI